MLIKDTYGYLLALFGIVALGAWTCAAIGRRRGERLVREGRVAELRERSIWTRDLLDNPFGRFVMSYVIPLLALATGLVEIVSRRARVKSFDYRGLDAVCIGVGEIGIGIMLLATHTFSAGKLSGSRLRGTAFWAGFACFVIGFSVALFRNI